MTDIHDPAPTALDKVRDHYRATGLTERLRAALERLVTDYYPGRQQASGWSSYFRFEDAATGTVQLKRAFLNNTAKLGDWTLFQSQAPNDGKSASARAGRSCISTRCATCSTSRAGGRGSRANAAAICMSAFISS